MTAKTRADLNTEADTNLADNTTGDISPEDVRTFSKNMADSAILPEDFTGLTAKTTPVDADTFLGADSAASGAVKKFTWSNIKATLKSYFDSVYTYRPSGTDVAVADGGTGRSSHTAYALICGGTTDTGAQQSVASVGTSGQVLTSNGPGALPTFQDASGGGGVSAPTTSTFPVGVWAFVGWTVEVVNGGTTSGSNVVLALSSGTALNSVAVGTQSGTWKNVSGTTRDENHGYGVRTA